MQKDTYPDKETAAKNHIAELSTLPTMSSVVYTDGSKDGPSLGWAAVRRHPRGTVNERTTLGHLKNTEVFVAEVIAIHRAVKMAVRGRPAIARVYSDNQAAPAACKYRATPSSQKEALEVQAIINHPKWKDKITLAWSPGHSGIPGNEDGEGGRQDSVAGPRTKTGSQR